MKHKSKRSDNYSRCESNYDLRELDQPVKTIEDIEYENHCEELKEEIRKKKIYDAIFKETAKRDKKMYQSMQSTVGKSSQ